MTGFLGWPRLVSASSCIAVRATALAGLLLATYQNWRAAKRDTALFALARPPSRVTSQSA